MELPMLEPVSMGSLPNLEIETALAEGDNTKIWQLARSGLPPKTFFDTLLAQVFKMSTQSRKGHKVVADQNSAMFMWPMVFNDQEQESVHRSVSRAHKALFTDTVMSLSRWMSNEVDIAMLSDTLNYAFLASQEPDVLRKFLNALVCRQAVEAIGTGADGIRLPVDAPRLVYYVGSMTRRNAWPCLPAPESLSSLELAKRLHSTLCLATQDAQASSTEGIIVGTPQPADCALASGLTMWLRALHQRYEFGQWDAVPLGRDRVDLVIELKRGELESLCIPLRTYQMGVGAIEKILIDLEHLCNEGVARGHH